MILSVFMNLDIKVLLIELVKSWVYRTFSFNLKLWWVPQSFFYNTNTGLILIFDNNRGNLKYARKVGTKRLVLFHHKSSIYQELRTYQSILKSFLSSNMVCLLLFHFVDYILDNICLEFIWRLNICINQLHIMVMLFLTIDLD